MSKRYIFVAIVLLVVALAMPVLAGTHAPDRTGFFVGFGVGGGNAYAEPGTNAPPLGVSDVDRESGGSGNFRFGWAVSDRATIGLESTAWLKSYNISGTTIDATITMNVTTFAVTYFPGNAGFYLRGGLGFGTAAVKYEQGGASVSGNTVGLGLVAASGYEWRLTEKFALGPQLQYAYLGVDNEDLDTANFVSLTAQMTWYW